MSEPNYREVTVPVTVELQGWARNVPHCMCEESAPLVLATALREPVTIKVRLDYAWEMRLL